MALLKSLKVPSKTVQLKNSYLFPTTLVTYSKGKSHFPTTTSKSCSQHKVKMLSVCHQIMGTFSLFFRAHFLGVINTWHTLVNSTENLFEEIPVWRLEKGTLVLEGYFSSFPCFEIHWINVILLFQVAVQFNEKLGDGEDKRHSC